MLPLALILLGGAGSAPAQTAQWGEITYPLFGNIRERAGTLLVFFRVDEPLPGEIGAWYQPRESHLRFSVANLRINERNSLHLFRRAGGPGSKGAMWTSMGLAAFPPGSPNLNSGGEKWNTDEAHHIAYTWDEQGNHRWWVGGQRMGAMQSAALQNGIGTPRAGEAQLTLGSRAANASSAITLYAVHILDRALTAEEFARPTAELFQAEPATLLLDRFDQAPFLPDGARETRAEVITGFNGERGGRPTAACRFITTPHGPGLRLYTPPTDDAPPPPAPNP